MVTGVKVPLPVPPRRRPRRILYEIHIAGVNFA